MSVRCRESTGCIYRWQRKKKWRCTLIVCVLPSCGRAGQFFLTGAFVHWSLSFLFSLLFIVVSLFWYFVVLVQVCWSKSHWSRQPQRVYRTPIYDMKMVCVDCVGCWLAGYVKGLDDQEMSASIKAASRFWAGPNSQCHSYFILWLYSKSSSSSNCNILSSINPLLLLLYSTYWHNRKQAN